jgi:heterodisulfide reductase subunit A
MAGFKLNKYNFCDTDTFAPLATSKDGIYVAGAFNGPMDIPESVTQSSGAAGIASGLIKKQRGKGIIHKSYPDEKELGDDVRIGVFVCHCGINIGSVVDVPGVSDYAGDMDGVVYYTESLYSCSQDAQDVLKDKIKEHDLNRVVIAACSPRTHEPLFQETLKDAGLNRSLFEMVNIRDQCSWVHANEPDAATDKSKDLVRMAVAKARHIQPLPEQTVPVNKTGLVLGGGIAGMTAALNLADQGFKCFLLEKEGSFGGNYKTLAHTKKLIDQIKKNKLITDFTNAELQQTSGFVGNFSSIISTGKGSKAKEITLDHGVIIIATGANEHKPETVLGNTIKYSKKIVTQSELSEQLEGKSKSRAPKSVLMVQCAGSRGDDLNYCSKTCCTTAVQNALKVKEINPDSQVIMLYRDIRTYGYAEDLYQEARQKGVLFIPYEMDKKPTISDKGSKLTVSFYDPILQDDVTVSPQMVALSVGMVPEETDTLSKLLKVPVTADSFFLEAHVKLRPVELPVDGVYVCGLAHSPKPINEIIAQAQAASAKAAMPLVKGYVTVDPIVSNIDKDICIGCRLCTSLCPYQAIQMVKDENNKPKAETIVASCKACGICASHCPTFAISMGGFTNEQLTSQIEAFGQEIKEKETEAA